MRFVATELPGAWILEQERLTDERGFFARTWCRREFAAHGIETDFPQGNVSFNRRRGTLRGLHFQVPPSREAKLVRCTNGEIHDVIVDLRCDSPTFMRHIAVLLSADNALSLYVPAGFAHGFVTLSDDAEVTYAMSDYYDAALSAGVCWDDPAFGIAWPIEQPAALSERDRTWPAFEPAAFTAFRGY